MVLARIEDQQALQEKLSKAQEQLAVALAQKGQKDESSSEFQKASELDSRLVAPH